MKRRCRWPLALVLAWLSAACSVSPQEEEPAYDLLLVGGSVVDGTGEPSRRADVAIAGDRIVAVGVDLSGGQAKHVIDVSGLTVAPGFWDNHAHLVTLEEHPLAENFIRQGITTIMASLHSQEQVFPFAPYRERVRPAPNIGLFAGHTWIRQQVMGLDDRDPTPAELEEMVAWVERSMEQGALGLSTGLEYVPAAYAKVDEIVALAEVAERFGGIYTTHLRDEGPGVLDAFEETLEVARRTGIPVQINHHKVTGADQFGWATRTLALIDEALAEGLKLAHDVYPYTAYSTYSDLMFPPWVLAGGEGAFAERVADPAARRRLVEEMTVRFRQQAGAGPESIQFREVAGHPDLVGRTLADFLAARGQTASLASAVEALIELQLAGGFIGIFHGMDEEDTRRIIQHPTSMFETDGDLVTPGDGHPHPRSYGSFPKVLGHYVRDQGVLTLEQAIRKMTALPAGWYGHVERGLVAESHIADVVVFDAMEIGDRASYIDPHHYAAGVVHVVINGTLVLEDGDMTGARPGIFLERTRRASSESAGAR